MSDHGLITPAAIPVDDVLRGIVEWVNFETPSKRADKVNLLQDVIAGGLQRLGVACERIPGRDGLGDHVVARYASPGASGAPVLLMGHIDTVWSVGTLAQRPVRVDGDRVYGPGIYDMKAGSYLAFYALGRIVAEHRPAPRPIVTLFNSDEEIGSPTSRDIIEREARQAAFVLVPEPAGGPKAAAVTSRKGWGRYRMRAFGRSSHAGASHSEGRSAIREIAHQILELEAMTDYEGGVTVNVGVVRGGTLLNVVPSDAEIEIDVRVPNEADAERMDVVLRRAIPRFDGVRIEVEGGWNRPPFVRSERGERLYRAASDLAGTLGFELPETMRGGVSDGNFSAALGRPTLDGLGCGGHGAHAEDEHIRISSIANRASLILNMLTSPEFQQQALGPEA